KRPSFDQAWQTLCAGVARRDWPRNGEGHLDKLLPERLRAFCKDGLGDHAPRSRVFDALAAWLAAAGAHGHWRDARAIALLHRVRGEARARLAELKRVRRLQTFDDLIDGVADALDGAHGDALAAALRAQYRFALVDEFQDTDPRQWAIFRRVFGLAQADAPPALFLVGDPKQAIYRFRGGDVHTYLGAEAVAERAPALDRNFRSRPGVLRAIATLYGNAGGDAFVEERIRFQPVQPGGKRADADFLRHGQPAPALTVRVVGRDPDDAQAKDFSADRARALATRACVAEIHALLVDARAGQASVDGRPLQPGDIAVLVRSHREATRIQRALAAAGIPAVAAGRLSLFATDEARELLALFEALLQPADDGRLRAALATLLLGLDAAAIAALDADGTALAHHQREAQDWRERWRRSGPFALVADRCAAAGPRLLGLLDGERRLTNYLQLGEAMQDAQVRAPGLHAQLDWLRNAIAEADPDDEDQLLRLESDAQRVQIVTLHKSKGLEYPLVFLPFVGIGGRPASPSRQCVVHDGGARRLQWKLGAAQAWDDACQRYRVEEEAEDARLLYVGLTRAEHALWLASGPFYNAAQTRLAPMLADLAALRAQPAIAVDAAPLAPPPAPLPAQGADAALPARIARRTLNGDWWVYSFTQLVKSEP
ncbi:MAG TPA: 3'-5' exonuclease, partial [Xanthomonadaceae bacterium]|nr:3'-5' exonuclease [Xanthomonadaceae bacterium]